MIPTVKIDDTTAAGKRFMHDFRQVREGIEFENLATQNNEVIHLSTVQLEMLKMSEDDIKNGRIVSEDELNKRDMQWLH
jgi:hypothetical protein